MEEKIKTSFVNGQHNSYHIMPDGSHTHVWFDTKTGKMGAHGENVSPEQKKESGREFSKIINNNWAKDIISQKK